MERSLFNETWFQLILIPLSIITAGYILQKLFKRLNKNWIPFILIPASMVLSLVTMFEESVLTRLIYGLECAVYSVGVYEIFKSLNILFDIKWRTSVDKAFKKTVPMISMSESMPLETALQEAKEEGFSKSQQILETLEVLGSLHRGTIEEVEGYVYTFPNLTREQLRAVRAHILESCQTIQEASLHGGSWFEDRLIKTILMYKGIYLIAHNHILSDNFDNMLQAVKEGKLKKSLEFAMKKYFSDYKY